MEKKNENLNKNSSKITNTIKQTGVKKKENKTTTSKIVFQNNHLILKEDGSTMISNLHRAISETTLPFNINHCYDFDRSIFDLLLNDNVCTGVRFYFGLNDTNDLCLIFTGLNGKNDLYIPLINGQFAVADMGQVCVPTTYGRTVIMLP